MSSPEDSAERLLEVSGLTKHFPVTRGVLGKVVGQVRAVDDVSFWIDKGETLGLVGESGSGKTTTGRALLRLIEPTSGSVRFEGREITGLGREEMRRIRRNMQIIFQDPFSSLNPKMRVFDIVGEAIEAHGLLQGRAVEDRVIDLLKRVGVAPGWVQRYPHEFSGGQRQRIGIARALALGPKLIVCDEAVSALDVSIRAQVINLLIDLRKEFDLSYLFIAHDLSVVQHIAQRVAVMYLGQIMEIGDTKTLFAEPGHPYTRALLSAVPVPNPRQQGRRIILQGDVPSPINPPAGCRFHPRCPAAFAHCREEEPQLVKLGPRLIKCFHAYDLAEKSDAYAELSERVARAEANRRDEQAHESAGATVRGIAELTRLHTSTLLDREQNAKEGRERRELGKRQKRRLLHSASSVLILCALALMLNGKLLSGTMVALLSYLGLMRRQLELKYRDPIFALLLGASIFAASAYARVVDLRSARAQIAGLDREIAAFYAAYGRYPASLSELGWRLYSIFDAGEATDPWGQPWRYAPPKADQRFRLGSLGPDSKPGSDDIGDPR